MSEPHRWEGKDAQTETQPVPQPLATIWRVSDDLRAKIQTFLAQRDPVKRTVRKRSDQRWPLMALSIYRPRSGVRWNRLPTEFGDDSSTHRTFQRWVRLGVFSAGPCGDAIWAASVADCAGLGGVNCEWQAADGAMSKVRLGGTWLAPTPPTEARTE